MPESFVKYFLFPLLIMSFVFAMCSLSHSQSFELLCPASTTNIHPVSPLHNVSTNKQREWLCVDPFGNVTIQGAKFIGNGSPTSYLNGTGTYTSPTGGLKIGGGSCPAVSSPQPCVINAFNNTASFTALPDCVITPQGVSITSFFISNVTTASFSINWTPATTTGFNFNWVCTGT